MNEKSQVTSTGYTGWKRKKNEDTKTRILVTGGAGFIGQHLTQQLLDDGYSVLVVDNLSNADAKNVPGGAELVQACVASGYEMPDDIDIVFHLAAHADVGESSKYPLKDLRMNGIGTARMAQQAAQKGVDRFIYTSTGAVYGDRPPANDGFFTEMSPVQPQSPYATSKLVAEYYVRNFGNTKTEGSFEPYIFRLPNVYGPGRLDGSTAGVVSIFSRQIIRSEPLTVRGDGTMRRDYVYVDDVVDALLTSLTDSLPCEYPINIGTGETRSIRDILQEFRRILHVEKPHPVTKHVEPRPGESKCTSLLPTLLKSMTAWEPETKFRVGVNKVYEYWEARLSDEGREE